MSLFASNRQKIETNFTDSVPKQVKSIITISEDIEGAVVNPGVYKLPLDSIIQDVLVACKGLSEEAHREFP